MLQYRSNLYFITNVKSVYYQPCLTVHNFYLLTHITKTYFSILYSKIRFFLVKEIIFKLGRFQKRPESHVPPTPPHPLLIILNHISSNLKITLPLNQSVWIFERKEISLK